MRLLVLAVASLMMAACGDDDGSGAPSSIVDELEAAGLGRYLGQIEPADVRQNDGWREYVFAPDERLAICLDGSPFQVNVRRGTTDDVILYLEGGGACWNAQNCSASSGTAKRQAGPAPAGDPGILDDDNPDNPFAGWNVVYASYCDGSVWGGDTEVDYGGGVVYHHGFQNVTAAVDVMLDEFPAPGRVVLAGSSAGGYGTFTGFGVLRIALPDTPLWIFDDSGPGIENPDDPQARQTRIDNWGYFERIAPSCERCGEQITYLTAWALDRDPALRVAYFNFLQDAVLRFFFAMEAGPLDHLLREVTGDVQSLHPGRMKRFLINGASHTTLLDGGFYDNTLDGITVARWTSAFLGGDADWIDLVDEPLE
jgi:hypothetical protein